jgi:hypothetical protein
MKNFTQKLLIVALCTSAFVGGVAAATPAHAGLVSLDFIWGRVDNASLTSPITGDTAATGPNKNAEGLMFTGQTGTWNSLNISPFQNSNVVGGVSTGPLDDGMGNPTSIEFAITTTYRGGADNGGGGSDLRDETAYLYPSGATLTGPILDWQITGLTPNAAYSLAVFGDGGDSNIANGVAGVEDGEGDWNWVSLTADGAGEISGTLTSATAIGPGIYGFQIQSVEAGVPEPSTLVLAALGFAGLTFGRRRRRLR